MNQGAGEPTAGPPRALVIVLRGLPLAYLGCYGNEWVRTKTLDRVADRGVTFDAHFTSHVSRTTPFVQLAALADAGIVFEHVRSSEQSRPWSLHSLRSRAYRLFEDLIERSALVLVETDALLPPWRPPRRWRDYYLESLAESDDEAPLTTWRGALPEVVDSEDVETFERIQSTFAAVLSAVDVSLGKFLAGCRSRGFGRDALIAITSDVGLALGEHGTTGFDQLCESTRHLPLILRLPGARYAGCRVGGLTQPGDLITTVAEYFNATLPCNDGRSLWPLIRQETDAVRNHLILAGGNETGVRTADRLAVFSAGPPRLYVKPDDRWEVNDLAAKMEDDVTRLVALIPEAS